MRALVAAAILFAIAVPFVGSEYLIGLLFTTFLFVGMAYGWNLISGYTAYVSFGQISKTEQCLSTELPLPAQVWDSYRDFANNMMSMASAMGPMAKGISDLREKMKDMRGYPLAVTTTANVLGHATTTTTEAVEIKRGAIPASAWQVPAGYTKIDNPMAKAGRPM